MSAKHKALQRAKGGKHPSYASQEKKRQKDVKWYEKHQGASRAYDTLMGLPHEHPKGK